MEYVICAFIWGAFVLHWLLGSLPKRRFFEVLAGCGIAICLTLLVLSLFGWFTAQTDVPVMNVLYMTGNVLYIAAIVLAVVSLVALRRLGKPKRGIEETTTLIKNSVFQVIRHPLYLGLALWSLALVLMTQSIPSTALGLVAFTCFWLASVKEDEFNIKKFGKGYREYMERVPAWNFIKGMMNKP